MSKVAFSPGKSVSHAGKSSRERRTHASATLAAPLSASAVNAMLRRKAHFQRFAHAGGHTTDQLATRLMLAPARVADLLSGRAPISNELATHIEEMLQLPASWLDHGGSLDQGVRPMNASAPLATNDYAELATRASAKDAPAAPASKNQINENRRLNLCMLTVERGTKNRLAQLASTSGSRISLMTSARKPVSDPFAFAIEDALGLPRGWLDQLHSAGTVPAPVWQALGADGATQPTSARTAPKAAVAAPARTATTPATIAVAAPSPAVAPQAPAIATPRSPVPFSPTGLFDKPAGQCGPIAEALVKTILNLSASDKLSEARAFELLGSLIAESSPPR